MSDSTVKSFYGTIADATPSTSSALGSGFGLRDLSHLTAEQHKVLGLLLGDQKRVTLTDYAPPYGVETVGSCGSGRSKNK